jgi:hypothetical protein
MKFCCYIFESFAECAGEAGLSIVVVTIAGRDSFVLQGRAVDAGTDVGYTQTKITVLTQQTIFRCPGCGVRLHRFYRRSMEELRREDLHHR